MSYFFRLCISSCPPRSYPDSQGVCQPCHESCDTCTGSGQSNCLACSPGHVRVIDLDFCMQQCPDGYFESEYISFIFHFSHSY